MEDYGEADVLQGVQLHLREQGFRLADLALLEERSRRAGGEMGGEEAEGLLDGLHRYLRSKGFRLADLALLEERSRRAGGEMGGEEAEGLLDELHRYLRSKGFRFADLALQEERGRRRGGSGGGVEGDEADNLLDELALCLRTRGFDRAALELLEERSRRATIYGPFMSLTRPHDYPQEIHNRYEHLRAWANRSLDDYKHEILGVLYPLFVQCCTDLVMRDYKNEARAFFSAFVEDHEQKHSEDINKMKPIFLAAHLEEMVLPEYWKTTQLRVKLCEYSYELLLQYLYKTKGHLILGMINEKITFEVYAGQVSPFPLGRATMVELVNTGSASALVAISALNLIAAQTESCRDGGYVFAQALISTLPYTYIPLGLLGVTIGVGAAKDHRLVGYAAGCLLAQILYLILMGGLRVLACRRVEVWHIAYVILVCSFFVILWWSYVFAYPKCVRSLGECVYDLVCERPARALLRAFCPRYTRRRFTRAVQVATASPELDLESNAVVPSVEMIGEQANQATARDGVTGTARLKRQ